jgi:C1A family cysteine protease
MTDEQRGAHLAAVVVTSHERRAPRSAKRAHRTRATIAILALCATLAGFGFICQTSLAAPRAPFAGQATRSVGPGAPHFTLAPVNPAFTRYVKARSMSRLGAGLGKHGLGLIPSPIDFSYLRGASTSLGATAYPSAYDLRPLGKLSAIEDQGQTGCCWTFATMGSLESSLLPSDPESFSEDNLALNSGFDSSLAGPSNAYNSGGNALMSTAYLARWGGPVAASQDAFDDSYTPPGLVDAKHVQDVLYLPMRTGPLDNDAIKGAIMNHGAVYTSMYADDEMSYTGIGYYFDSYDDAYYYYGAAGQQDHAVDIVGWDDNYPASNFATTAPGNGAFIVRNSWGLGWGDAGYFYVSYYDTNFAYQLNVSFDDAESPSNYGGIYQYDPLGWTNQGCYGDNATTDWCANVFTAVASAPLTAVSFYAAVPGTTYTVYAGGSLSALTAAGSGTLDTGYHTVALSSPLQLTNGQPFVVAVQLTTPGYNYPIPVEYPISGYSSNATSAPGESFVSTNGTTWNDLTSQPGCSAANVCLKAFTGAAAPNDTTPPTTTLIPAHTQELNYWNKVPCTFTFTATDNGGSGVAQTGLNLDNHGWVVWGPNTVFTVPAPANHSNDGSHTFLLRSIDNANNAESPQSFTLGIDTRRPSAKAPHSATARRGAYATLKFKLVDPKPSYGSCLAVITVKTLSGHRKLTLMPKPWYKSGKLDSLRFRCKLPRGKYRFFVTAWDGAANSSAKAATNLLTVR